MGNEHIIEKLTDHLRAVYCLVTELDLIQSTSPLNHLRQDYCDTINTIVGLLRQCGMDELALDELRDDLEYNQAARHFNNFTMQRYQERCPVEAVA